MAVVGGALLMLWPAIYNSYPLLYPDSISYLGDGRPLAKILFLHRPTGYMAMRSEIYSLGIFFFHWNVTAWPIIALQALLTSIVIWLVVRSLVARHVELHFLALVALLSLTTSLSWYVCFVMPDILGPVLYLSIYLLVFARETLSVRERWGVAAIAWWAMAAHPTHLLVAVVVCTLLGILHLLRYPAMRARGRAVAGAMAIIALVVASQMALHKVLYGKTTLNGNRMPYLMARIVADGPGRWYLEQHCGELRWAICERVGSLPDTDDDFLWEPGGVWVSASAETQKRMLREEIPLVLASVRAYPRAQMQRSLTSFWAQLGEFGLWDFCPNSWLDSKVDLVLPGTRSRFMSTQQDRGRLPKAFFTVVQQWLVAASVLGIVVGVPVLWRRQRWRVLGAVAIVVPAVIANAFVTAVLSEVDSRYQSRVIWLVPLAAGLIALDLLSRWRSQRLVDDSVSENEFAECGNKA
jgi:hypothetical protein